MEAMKNVRSAHVFDLKWLKEFYLVFGIYYKFIRLFSHDVTAAILVSQNNETAAMFVSQTSPVGVELFSQLCKCFLLF